MKFIVSVKQIVIEAKNDIEAKIILQRNLGSKYSQFIEIINFTCNECDYSGGHHERDCSKALVF